MSLDGMPYTYDQVGDALKKIRKQFLRGTKVLKWTGPDKLDKSVAVTMQPPSWHFSPEGLEYHAERGRDFWDVYANVAFNLGYHSGVLIEKAKQEPTEKLLAMYVSQEHRYVSQRKARWHLAPTPPTNGLSFCRPNHWVSDHRTFYS